MFLNIKDSLNETDIIGNDIRSLEGKNIIDVFSFYFGLYTYDKVHEIVEKIRKNVDLKKAFLDEISYIGKLILNSGILNSVVAYIDLVDGFTDNEIYEQTEEKLLEEGIMLDNQIFSTVRLSKNVVSMGSDIMALEKIFKEKKFLVDSVNLKLLCNNLNENNVNLYVIGSTNDSLTPIEAIEEEEKEVENYNCKDYYKFIFSDGNHREWKDNQELLYPYLVR